MNIEKVLVAVDFSPHSEAALKLSLNLVETFGAELHLVHVFPEPLAMAPPYGPALPADFGMQIERAAVNHFQEWQEKFCPTDLAVTSYVRRGDASKQIIEAADELDIDLIVMGTRGTTGLEHILMGSVAERTVRSAHCPVLTTKGVWESNIPPEEFDFAGVLLDDLAIAVRGLNRYESTPKALSELAKRQDISLVLATRLEAWIDSLRSLEDGENDGMSLAHARELATKAAERNSW